jgi:uncharacterized protein (TIGR02001 family)
MKMWAFRAGLGLAVSALAMGQAVQAADIAAPVYKAAPVAVSPWDVAFGASIATDYNFRGISQSDRGPSVGAYVEGQYNVSPMLQLYAAIAGASVDLPTDPTAEIDYYGGARLKLNTVTLDAGLWYYQYPRETVDTDFLEVYGKLSWAVTDSFVLGGGVYYTADWLKTGADGTYVSGTAKYSWNTGTPVGMYLGGELGHYSFGTPDAGFVVHDYTYWNAGLGFTYKAFTLDLRYHDTDLNEGECSAMTGDSWVNGAPGRSNWCGDAYVAKLSFDTTLSSLK